MSIKQTTSEQQRLDGQNAGRESWHEWGPYLSERQWGTVREDYSALGEPWHYFPHDHARSRAYRWGEDGIAGFCDSKQRLCLGLALWNGKDAILKERLFGLANGEGNHGEDVKELYYYLDATPSHSYLKMLYKYPRQAYPYGELVEENRRRDRNQPEFELLDTGLFDADDYFDVFVEYAKAAADDILMRITAHNRGKETASLHILPHVWFRNTWSWGYDDTRPSLSAGGTDKVINVEHAPLGGYYCYCDGDPDLLFTDNNTNTAKLYGLDTEGYFKDAFHDAVINGQRKSVNPGRQGTKACAHYDFTIPAGDSQTVYLRLSKQANGRPFDDAGQVFNTRIAEADAFYDALHGESMPLDEKMIQRQAFAGMIWNKQFYYYDIPQWLNGDPGQPKPPDERLEGRNKNWFHLNNADIVSMPDKWEYPWYASWDLAFHCVIFAKIDPGFAKKQILTLTHDWYIHPNGQFPAYEWSFDDANPPVHAWAAWEIYQTDCKLNNGKGDICFILRIICNYSADTPYFHGTRMTPMERISTDLLSVFCGLAINEKAPFIRIYQSNPCHPCAIFKG